MIDVVITYVNNEDKKWAHDYLTYSRIEKKAYKPNGVRFRSWDNFKYILRGIAQYIPFANNLYIIVSGEGQIPEFINTDNVRVVYHHDIIPKQYLPTFNSNAIEMFMYRIPGLSENFIYLNDDMLFLKEHTEQDFFDENMNPRIAVRETVQTKTNIYIRTLLKTQSLTKKENIGFKFNTDKPLLRSDHAPNPMRKSMWEHYWNKYENELSSSITRFRKDINITQELSNYHYYMYYNINSIDYTKRRFNKYFSYKKHTSDYLQKILNDPSVYEVCINDGDIQEFELCKNVTNKMLEKRLPNKCKYEK